MDNTINLEAPIRTVIVRILNIDPSIKAILGRTKDKDIFFQDLLSIGFDFYELLELFVNCDAVSKNASACIIDNVPQSETIKNSSEKEIRRMIPHWTSSRYHSASIEDVCNELKEHIKNKDCGTFIFNSNSNTRNKKSYNDMYILFLTDSEKYFFDINRKKAFRICNTEEDEIK